MPSTVASLAPRASGSRFGAELDSLVDAISFGLAPAMLMFFAVFNQHSWDWIWCFFFTMCAVLRLARFNVEQAGRAKSHFNGLPSPMAGMTLGDVLLVPRIGTVPDAAPGRPAVARDAAVHHGRPGVPHDQPGALRRRAAHRLQDAPRDPGNADRDRHAGGRDLPAQAVLLPCPDGVRTLGRGPHRFRGSAR